MIKGLPMVCKLVDGILIGGRVYKELSERVEVLLVKCRMAGMTLASNKVQVGSRSPSPATSLRGALNTPILKVPSTGWAYATN